VQGSKDRTVPHTQSEAFQAALLAKGDTCDFITITNAQHRILDWEKFDPQWQAQIITWLEQKMPPTK
jgi:dipeptidyl aminopeptidase/acylaminoacyl peptidase